MKKLIVAFVVVVLGWKAVDSYRRASLAAEPAHADPFAWASEEVGTFVDKGRYSCDGRTHCSQMTSCEEATYFIEHCPGTQMDGDDDGVPCESQWCGK
jgi:hypothetical protein